jgi:hypothetical protein
MTGAFQTGHPEVMLVDGSISPIAAVCATAQFAHENVLWFGTPTDRSAGVTAGNG